MAFLVAREEKVMMVEERILIDRQKVKSRKKYYFVKRIFDVVLSIGGLIILSPMMAVIAYKIKRGWRACILLIIIRQKARDFSHGMNALT